MDEKEKFLLEKKYSLPEAPNIIVHPSRTAKSGKFDCTVMSLSLLLDYRPEDTKEHSFEVSLFAELFNEMLMRDFGFYIYKALCTAPAEEPKEDPKDDKKRKDSSSSEKTKDFKKKDDKKSESSDNEDTNSKKGRSKKTEKRKRIERVKSVTVDPRLLLSFVYFDQTHCGYLFQKDIEDLIFTLGLQLSRAQVRKVVAAVVTRDALHYRKLTDKIKEEIGEEKPIDVVDDCLDDLAMGNKNLLPVFESESGAIKDGKSEQESNKTSSTENSKGKLFCMNYSIFTNRLIKV